MAPEQWSKSADRLWCSRVCFDSEAPSLIDECESVLCQQVAGVGESIHTRGSSQPATWMGVVTRRPVRARRLPWDRLAGIGSRD